MDAILNIENNIKPNSFDKYFMVQCILDGNKAEIGCIDKVFKKKAFINSLSDYNFKKIELHKVLTFTKQEYYRYKLINKDKVNF